MKKAILSKNCIVTIVSFLPAIVLAVVIFALSSQPGEASTKTSTAVGRFVIGCYLDISGNVMNEEMIELRAIEIDEIVRKSAHMTEYAILAICLYAPIMRLKKRKWTAVPQENNGYMKLVLKTGGLHAFLLAVLYAASDEIHQVFVPGRWGGVKDVLIDSVGVFFGIIFFTFLIFPSLKKK